MSRLDSHAETNRDKGDPDATQLRNLPRPHGTKAIREAASLGLAHSDSASWPRQCLPHKMKDLVNLGIFRLVVDVQFNSCPISHFLEGLGSIRLG